MTGSIASSAGFLAGGAIALSLLSRKWGLEGRTSAALVGAATVFAVVLGGLLPRSLSGLAAGLALAAGQFAAYAGMLLYLFFRDPDRMPSEDPVSVVSPADGKVLYLKRLEAGQGLAPEKKGNSLVLDELSDEPWVHQPLWHIGISMVFSDVHVNRSPIPGRVTMVRHRPGRFLSLRRDEAVQVNERQVLVIENDRSPVAIVQIASRLVRRIRPFVRAGDQVEKGQRIGVITFGSQVDVFIPTARLPTLEIKIGQRLIAGVTVLGRLSKP